MPPTGSVADRLRALGAPRELTEWARKLPPDPAGRAAWIDAPRADWIPYLAMMRGIGQDAIVRAAAECALEAAGKLEGPEGARALDVLRATASHGRDALASAETDLSDLKLAIIAWSHQTRPTARPPWMHWTELVLELARAHQRGNMLVGIALAMRLIAGAGTRGKPTARPAHGDLVARFRDKLTLAGSAP